jgi:phospho-N-acetylmuramoyl-pentapeptide-transferase
MILALLDFLSQFIKIPAAFSYVSTRMVLAALTSLFIVFFFGSKVITFLYNLKTGQSIRVEDCPMLAALHEKKKNTPSMGGLLILGSIFLSSLFWMKLSNPFTYLLLFCLISLGVVGGVDDYLKMKLKNSKGIKSSTKFLLQLLIAMAICSYLYLPQVTYAVNKKMHLTTIEAKMERQEAKALTTKAYPGIYYLPFKKSPFFILTGAALILGALITIFVITGTSNAVNLSDGLDGLATGLVMMVAGVLAICAFLSNHRELASYLNILYIEGSGEIGVFLMALIGSCIGFLWYNAYPAQVFMGDVGSLSLGGALGLSSVLLRKEFLLALAGGVLVAEALSVILQVGSYKLRKKRIFRCAPLHHHFEYKGWTETKIVIRLWIIGLLLALVSLFSLKLQ